MKKYILVLAMIAAAGSFAFASDDDDSSSSGCWAGATAYAENFAKSNLGVLSPKRVGNPFYSKNRKAIIVLIKDQSDGRTEHIAIPLVDESTCKFGQAHK